MSGEAIDRSLYGTAPDGHACEPAASVRERTITQEQLPLCCPLPQECLWNAHPRVYLPIRPGGEARCPYCGTVYRLAE